MLEVSPVCGFEGPGLLCTPFFFGDTPYFEVWSRLRHAGLVCWTRRFFALAPAMPLGLPATLLGPGGLPDFLLTMGVALGRSDAISMGSGPNLCLTEGGGPNLCLTRTRSLGSTFSSVGGFHAELPRKLGPYLLQFVQFFHVPLPV